MTAKEQIIDLFRENVKGKSPNVEGRNPRHDGKKGHWLEFPLTQITKLIYGDMN